MKKKKLLKIMLAMGSAASLSSCKLVDDIKSVLGWNDYSYSYNEDSTNNSNEQPKEPEITYASDKYVEEYNTNKQNITKDYFEQYKGGINFNSQFKNEFDQYLNKTNIYKVLINDTALGENTKDVKEVLSYLTDIYSKVNPSFKIYGYDLSGGYDLDKDNFACYITCGAPASGNVASTSLYTLQDGRKMAQIMLSEQSVNNMASRFSEHCIDKSTIVKKAIMGTMNAAIGIKHDSENPNSAFHNGITENGAWKYSPSDLKCIYANYATIDSDEKAKDLYQDVKITANAYYSQLLVPYYKYSVANNFKEFNQGDNADNGSPIYGSIPKTIEDNRKIYMGAINTRKSFSAIENKYVYDYSFGEEITVNASEIGQYQVKSLHNGNVTKTVTGNCYIVHNTELETMSNVKDFIVFENAKSGTENKATLYLAGMWGSQDTGKVSENGERIFANNVWKAIDVDYYSKSSACYRDITATKTLTNKAENKNNQSQNVLLEFSL